MFKWTERSVQVGVGQRRAFKDASNITGVIMTFDDLLAMLMEYVHALKSDINIHFRFLINPDTFNLILREYTSMMSNCHLYWIQDWADGAFLNEANSFMRRRMDTDEMRDKVTKCMSEMHLYMLNECRQAPWTGTDDREINSADEILADQKCCWKLGSSRPGSR